MDGAPRDNAPTLHDGGSATLLQWVFDHAGEGISVFDGALQLRAWNQRFLDYTGIDARIAQRGVPLARLLRDMAERGEFGACELEAEVQRRLVALSGRCPSTTQRRRPNGHTLELRRNPTPDGGFVMLYADITERVNAEAALGDEQRMLALVQQRTEQGFWFIDNEYRATDANPAMCRLLGLPREAVLGRSIFEFVDESQAAVFRRGAQDRERGLATGYEVTLRRADGSAVHCYNNATPILDEQGRKIGALGLFSDITRFKQVEQQLRQTGERLAQKSQMLSNTLESLDQGVLSMDAQGRINSWNQRALVLLEVPEAVMQRCATLDELLHYQTTHGLLEPSENAGLARPSRYQRRRRDGTLLEVRTHAAADGSLVRTYTDVTAEAQAQQALRESEDRFRSVADGAPAFIWLTGPDHKPIWFNQRWLQQTGRTMTEELACPWPERMHADDLETCRAAYRDAAATCSPYSVEYRLRRRDGSLIWVADNGIPRLAEDGSLAGYTVYGWDITERKASEVALRAAKEEAERANRAKSEFLSRMSHELRTPLNAVLGFAQLLLGDTEQPLAATQRSRVQELMRGGRHLLSLINDVLDISRIEAGALQLQLSPVDLPALVHDCLRLVQPMADERAIKLLVPAEPDLAAPGYGRVQADATRLKQVVLNLLSNAIKYNRAGGTVVLAWHEEPETDTLRIDVEDTGPGLSAAQQERLFQAFERLDAARGSVEGAGIGLALSKWLVGLMRGEIGVHSQPGQGSRFWVRLARSPAPTASASEAHGANASGSATAAPVSTPPTEPSAPTLPCQRTVLYIEDNAVNQLLMEGMLAQRPGLRLLLASLPETGLLMAAQARPDLVLLDIQLPGIDGFEVLRRLRAQPGTRDIPVVAVSANAMQSDLDAARVAGFVDYVTKPLDLHRLLAVVDRLLA
jgi:PAS domain S-box-containing protein